MPPALILDLGLSGTLMHLTWARMREVLRQDYVRTARAKGLSERLAISRRDFPPVIAVNMDVAFTIVMRFF